MFATNTTGVMLSYKYAALQMIKQGRGGRIIGTYSVQICNDFFTDCECSRLLRRRKEGYDYILINASFRDPDVLKWEFQESSLCLRTVLPNLQFAG